MIASVQLVDRQAGGGGHCRGDRTRARRLGLATLVRGRRHQEGACLSDWAYLELADLKADEFNDTLRGPWTRGLLIQRNIADQRLAYFTN